MTNEQKLRKIVSDPVLYIESFMKIYDKSGKLVPFILNPQQRDFIENMEKYNVILKSRQIGLSSICLAYSLYLAQTRPSTHCLLASYSIDSATSIFDKLKSLYNEMPEVLRIPLINNNKKELKFKNGSRLIVSTVSNKTVARGMTLHFCHISEMAFIKDDVVSQQLLAIEQAVVPTGNVVIESTANGFNTFSEIVGKAERQDSLYKLFFYDWVSDRQMFRDEYEIFCDRYIKLHGKMPELDELDDDEKALMEMGATIEQIVWRKLKIANSDIDSFRQEFPSTIMEAFLNTGNNVFEAKLLQDRLNHIHEVKTIPKPNLLPSVAIPYYGRGLNMYHAPEPNEKYFAGVDCSEGVGNDYSAIEIINSDGCQVCEFRSNTIKPFQFSQLLHDLAVFYNKAFLVIEKASSGHVVIDKMRNEYKYQNLFKHKEYDQRGKTIRKPGFLMTQKSKPLLFNNFVELLTLNQILINSKDLLNEMKLFQYENGGMNAQRGFNDDLCIAFALALHGMGNFVQYA